MPKPASKRQQRPKRPPTPPLLLEGQARLEAVNRQVKEFFEYADRDQPLRYMLASERIFAWLDAMGVKFERPFDLRQMCEKFLEWTGPMPIGMPQRK